MKQILLIFLTVSFLFSCSQNPEKKIDVISTDQLFEDYYQFKLKINPVEATKAGENDFNHYIANYISDQYLNDCVQQYNNFLTKIDAIDKELLSQSDLISLKAMRWDCAIKLEGLQNKLITIPSPIFDLPHFKLMPLTQLSSFQLYMGQMASGASVQPFKTVVDYDHWLSRVDDYLVWLATAQSNMIQGIKDQIVLPQVLIERMIIQVRPMAEAPLKEHIYYGAVELIPSSISAEEVKRITLAYSSMIEEKVKPAHADLLNFLKNEYLPAGRQTDGIDALPNGLETYQYLIKYHTTTNMLPKEVFELGKREVNRITLEMEQVKSEVGFQGTLKAFFNYVRTKPELRPFTKPEEVIAHFNSIKEKMEPSISKLFNIKPKASFEVRRTESFREASASAEYVPGNKDGSRPGVFYVPIPNISEYNILSDEALFLHEAIPGHHYQLSLQQENNNLPEFLHSEGVGVYVEGWALYAESLGKELGLYQDPYQYFGMLSMEMHRAIRLVVDAGIHTQGWTREQAIKYSLDHEAESEASITSEIERYMAIPAQAISYKVGQLKIKALRDLAKDKIGEKFDIREFHDQVLNSGSLPLVLLEEKINQWISTKLSLE